MKTESQAKKEILASIWLVKGVKFMPGHDAPSMSCSLYRDGKRVATVWDDSWGGGFQYTWLKPVAKEFDTFCESFTVITEYSPEGMTYNMDIVVDELVSHFEYQKQIKKICKNKTAYVLVSDPENVWSINRSFTPAMAEHLRTKHGKDLKEILNEQLQ
jgi:hypothetical protein